MYICIDSRAFTLSLAEATSAAAPCLLVTRQSEPARCNNEAFAEKQRQCQGGTPTKRFTLR